MKTLREVSDFEWVEFAEVDSIKSLPIEAPVMTVTRAFLKDSKEYSRKISAVKGPIEAETKHPCVFSWTIDAAPEGLQHKWLMLIGWNSKKHHEDCITVRHRPFFSIDFEYSISPSYSYVLIPPPVAVRSARYVFISQVTV